MSEFATILLVEDSEDDILLARRAFQAAKITVPLTVVRSGMEAIAYLSGEGRFSNREEFPLPELVLLDLKLPGVTGIEVLRWIRGHQSLRSLRVVVLTSSEDIRDVNAAYHFGANSFVVKDVDFNNSKELARMLTDYWLLKSEAPDVSRPAKRKTPKPGE